MMSATEILNQIMRLSSREKRMIFETLETELRPENGDSEGEQREREFELLLLEKGIISSIPSGWNEDEDFEPIEVTGKPLSETIIEDRG
jgi:hypothetical protein